MKPPKTVLRVAAIHRSELLKTANHNLREGMGQAILSRIDISRTPQNLVLIGPATADQILADIVADVAAHPPKRHRKKQRIAGEIVASASPEYFRPDDPAQAGTWDSDRLASWIEKTKKWVDTRYGEDARSMVVHLDEASPHAHIIVVPKGKDRRLSYKAEFDRHKLVEFQSDYAKAVAELGIQRGEPGSRAKHTTVKNHYRHIQEAQALADEAKAATGNDVEWPEFVPKGKFLGISQVWRDKEVKALLDEQKTVSEKKIWAAEQETARVQGRLVDLLDQEASLYSVAKAKAYQEAEEMMAEQKRQIEQYNRQLLEARAQCQNLKASMEKGIAEKDEEIAALQKRLVEATAHAGRFKERAETAETWVAKLEHKNTQMEENIHETRRLAQDLLDDNGERLEEWKEYFREFGMSPTERTHQGQSMRY